MMTPATEKMAKKVYLVGAGPGDPGLLTIAALRVLQRADVVLYDRLVDRRVMKLIPKSATKVYVGASHHQDARERQGRIYELMKNFHDEGKVVVRLKNGDPFLFGRGGEEVHFLRGKGIPFEVVPGVTSATGVPSWVGLPLTHREYSSAVLVISGHPANDSVTDWSTAARFRGTLVILMGAGTLASACRRLVYEGMDPSTPACAISRGTMEGEKIVHGRLDELGDLAAKERLMHPAVAVVGEVVKLAGFWKPSTSQVGDEHEHEHRKRRTHRGARPLKVPAYHPGLDQV